MFLSHDVDQIHDRELFRVLADVNHIKRRIIKGEPGNVLLAGRRVARALLCPKRALKDFETLLEMEGRHGFRSTFFLLHDKYWARNGARYTFQCRAIQEIVKLILGAGAELGLHGGYYRFNNVQLYRESRDAVEKAFGVRPRGIRNHLLRFSYPETWRAQSEAGFGYDATYGFPEELGPRGGWPFPFQTFDGNRGNALDLIALPITVMDVTVFRYLRLEGAAAWEAVRRAMHSVIGAGGLVSLLWHNNYFNEPEYQQWQEVYKTALHEAVALDPWCATGSEISEWWRARGTVRMNLTERLQGPWRFELSAGKEIHNLTMTVPAGSRITVAQVDCPTAKVKQMDGQWLIEFPLLRAGERVAGALLP